MWYRLWEAVVGQIYLGGKAFCDRMQQLVDAQPRSKEHSQAQRRIVTQAFDAILDEVVETFNLSSELFRVQF